MDYGFETSAREKGFVSVCGTLSGGEQQMLAMSRALMSKPKLLLLDEPSMGLAPLLVREIFDIIKEKAEAFSVGIATAREIDEINILQATYLAMKRAVEGLRIPADYALVDGNRMPPLSIPGETVIKGDAKCPSIAAASIIAKVSRDRYMYELDREMPEYQFAKHKGYGTALHYEMIKKYGISDYHRLSFLKNLSEHN